MNCLGVDLHRTGQYDLALKSFAKIESIDSTFEQSYCNRIATYREMGDHEKAEEMFYLARLYREPLPRLLLQHRLQPAGSRAIRPGHLLLAANPGSG